MTPGPKEIEYPTLLPDQPAPRLHAYPRASVVAEKLEAIVSLGMGNSRMKDVFNLRAPAPRGRDRRNGSRSGGRGAQAPLWQNLDSYY